MELFEYIDQRFSKEVKRLVNQRFSPFSPGELDKAMMSVFTFRYFDTVLTLFQGARY
jgi:hypothetical protein